MAALCHCLNSECSSKFVRSKDGKWNGFFLIKERLVVFDIIDKCLDSYFLIALLPEVFNEVIKEEKNDQPNCLKMDM